MDKMSIMEMLQRQIVERRNRLEQKVIVNKEYTNEDIVMIMQRLAKYDLLLVIEYLPKLCHIEFIGPEAKNYGDNQEVMVSCLNYHKNHQHQLNEWLTKLEAELLLIEQNIQQKQRVLPDFLKLESKENEVTREYLNAQSQLANLIAEVAEGNGYVSAPSYEEFINKYQEKLTATETKVKEELKNPIFSHAAEFQLAFLTKEEERYQEKYYRDYLINAYAESSHLASGTKENYDYFEEKPVRI